MLIFFQDGAPFYFEHRPFTEESGGHVPSKASQRRLHGARVTRYRREERPLPEVFQTTLRHLHHVRAGHPGQGEEWRLHQTMAAQSGPTELRNSHRFGNVTLRVKSK